MSTLKHRVTAAMDAAWSPLTADTITDDQIRELEKVEWASHILLGLRLVRGEQLVLLGSETCNNLRSIAHALGHSGIFDGVDCRMSHGNEAAHVREGRARCAEILNARAKEGR